MKPPPVTIYSLTTCGWSRKTKEYFTRHGVDFHAVEYDMAGPDLQRKISAEMRQHGAEGFPFVKIGGNVVKGYDTVSFARLLGLT
jgi:glutaredoxin